MYVYFTYYQLQEAKFLFIKSNFGGQKVLLKNQNSYAV
jgi:hypothetical protein